VEESETEKGRKDIKPEKKRKRDRLSEKIEREKPFFSCYKADIASHHYQYDTRPSRS